MKTRKEEIADEQDVLALELKSIKDDENDVLIKSFNKWMDKFNKLDVDHEIKIAFILKYGIPKNTIE